MRRRWFPLLLATIAAAMFWMHGSVKQETNRPDSHADGSMNASPQPRSSASSQQRMGKVAQLFAFVEPANRAALNAALPAPARTVHYVRIDRRLIESKASPFWQPGGVLIVPMPTGAPLRIAVDESTMLGPDRFTSVGHVAGVSASRVVFAYNAGFLSGSIDLGSRGFALRPADAEVTQFYELDASQMGECGGLLHPPIDRGAIIAAARRKSLRAEMVTATLGSATPTGTFADALYPAGTVVDVMMVYTQAVKTTLTGDARLAALQSEFDAAIARVNADLAASQVSARVRLVKILQTQYDADGTAISPVDGLQSTALTALYQTSDGQMDDIHPVRDQVGADIVMLVLNRSDPASIGLSFVLDTPAAVDPSGGVINPEFAFSVVHYADIAGTDLVPHELGHVFGCAHARGDVGATGTKDGAYTYSYGYRYADKRYHDIMAYSPGIGLSYYSNPEISPAPENAPIGIAPGQPGEADCAQTIEQTAFEVSTYRLQAQAAPAGTLINVSTRAFVGTGDQVLIGGFAIGGTEPKRVLVRGAGPALTAFGVGDALTTPVLQIYSGSTVIAQNTGWGNQANAADVAAAATQVGAFAFPAASGDDALLVTLQPGLYTAILQDANATSGSGLVEAYDVDRTGNRIVNLSTRGYADKGREMFGGFVVQGATGTTKRVLIRVLGPTLSRSYGIPDAMIDPMLALYDSNGNLLLKNDDWSSGDVGGTTTTANDFNPAVTTYDEQQIAATNLAPANRREPCVMVDLAPGAYSVVAQPFEDLTANPPETASPGVGIIEVFEIQ